MADQLFDITADDFDQVYQLWLQCDGLGGLENRDQFTRFINRNDSLSQLVRDDERQSEEQVIATLMCGHDGRRGYLYHLAVHPDARGRGLAKLLIDTCLQKLSLLQIQRCTVFVRKDNPSGVEFWMHNGWWNRSDLDTFAFDLQIN